MPAPRLAPRSFAAKRRLPIRRESGHFAAECHVSFDEQEESFAELFEQSLKQDRPPLAPGQKVTGTVVQVGPERVVLDLGHGRDGIADIGEFSERGQTAVVRKGDTAELYVVRIENRMAVLARSLGKGPAARLALAESARTGVPVEGTVSEVNKGGYSVEVAGVRCFCPMGQMDTRRIEDPATMLGKRLTFRVTEMRGQRDVVLSRRVLLEEEAAEKAAKLRDRLKVGERFTGTVTSLRDFGAFVDIGGMEGLLHASEMGYGRVRPADVVQPGQQVEVELIRIDPPGPKDRTERLAFSMKGMVADPWETALVELVPGDIVQGTVQRVQPFGAFVQIVPGVDGLLHVSAFGRRIGHPSDVVRVGETVAVRVDVVDTVQRRLSLSYVSAEELASIVGEGAAAATAAESKPLKLGHTEPVAVSEEAAAAAAQSAPARRSPESQSAPAVGSVLDVTVEKIEPFGLFVTWAAGRGLVPASELETPKGADLRKAFPVGTALRVAVLESREGKVRLSAREAVRAEERNEARAWMQTQKPVSGKGFGTLADLLGKAGK